MTYLSLFRKNLSVLSTAFASAANIAPSTLGRYLARDPKFFDSCQTKDIRVGTYDFIVGRFSALWPSYLPWPDGIDRPAPSPIEPETLDWFLPKLNRNDPTTERLPTGWPKDQPWPTDIQLPEK